MENDRAFNPNDHLMKVGGSQYLPIAWRIVWLRKTWPGAIIETTEQLHTLNGDGDMMAVFKARVEIPLVEGAEPVTGGVATGWGSETSNDFKDYYEKAETKALGRALAALGFGAQFAAEEYEAADKAPQQRRNDQRVNDARSKQIAELPADRPAKEPTKPTDKQTDEIREWFEGAGMSTEDMTAAVRAIVGHKNAINREEAGKVIYRLRSAKSPEEISNLIID